MVSVRRFAIALFFASPLLLPLASCANSGLGQTVQDSLAADPKLKQAAPDGTLSALSGSAAPESVPSPGPSASPLPSPGVNPSPVPSPSSSLPLPSPNSASSPAPTTAAQPSQPLANASPAPTPTSSSPAPSPQDNFQGGELFLGLSGTLDQATGASTGTTAGSGSAATGLTTTTSPNSFADLDQAPKELKQYVADLAQLGVLNLTAESKAKAIAPENFLPNKPISRREYARWLFAANNRLFSDRAAQQIRPAQPSAQPAFRDLPPSDPDFAAIQGLAEAGIIPSTLSGDPTAITFRADAQISRETLLRWKVPMDTRQTLPTATLDAVKQAWGFQDAPRIDPLALRAVLADYQNGDLANIRRAFGYTTLFQPKKAVTRAEAAATLWYFGYQGDGRSARM